MECIMILIFDMTYVSDSVVVKAISSLCILSIIDSERNDNRQII